VVVGVDAHDPAATVLAFAREAATASDVPVRAVHAWTLPATWWFRSASDRALFAETEEGALVELLARDPEPIAVPDVRCARPADALADAARSAGLIVLGRTGHRLGPVARAVIHRAWCPVAVVPRGRPGASRGPNAQNR
jgi:nucleotide-binding universal stress UspA family protein